MMLKKGMNEIINQYEKINTIIQTYHASLTLFVSGQAQQGLSFFGCSSVVGDGVFAISLTGAAASTFWFEFPILLLQFV